MCEESACLVPPLETTQNGPSEPRPSFSVSSGSGGVAHNGEALVGFHEDALSQAAMGKAQFLLAIVLGLGLAAECSEIAILNYILPSAELHLCIGEHRKGWLVSITLLAMAGGSFAWGILGDHLGRRRALISALSVAALFSAVAAVMPTYGTFMTARFCSGLGIAGAFPLSFTYLAETCSRATRCRFAGILHSMWPLGALYTSMVSQYTMPSAGAEIVQDNREHWSSWHKFLILSILPIISCIIGLMWASESPRYLLEASREVEALAVYQRLHRLNKARTQYGLTELELPGRGSYRERPTSPSKNVFSHGMNSFKETLQRISSPLHFRTTLLLALLHLILGFTYMGVSTFSWSYIKQLRDQQYQSSTAHLKNVTYTERWINMTLENVEFKNCIFKNSTFTHMSLNHVNFLNCTFEDTEFTNVKASISSFVHSVIQNCRFIDSDITHHNFIESFEANNTFISVISDCFMDFDFNIYMEELYRETAYWAGSMGPVLFILGFMSERYPRPPAAVIYLFSATLASGCIMFMSFSIIVGIIEAFIKMFLTLGLNIITLVVVEAYPCHLRCTAHGLLRSLYHLASLCAIPIFNSILHTHLVVPALFTVSLTVSATILAGKIQDNSKVLL